MEEHKIERKVDTKEEIERKVTGIKRRQGGRNKEGMKEGRRGSNGLIITQT